MFSFTPVEELNEHLGFVLDDELYSINVENVQEIITIPPITRVPNSPRYVEGAINLRGKVLKIVNLRKKFERSFKHFDANTRIVVLKSKTNSYGILVDQVLEVFKVDKTQKSEMPRLFRNEPRLNYANKILKNGDKLFLNIDFNKIDES